MTRIRFIAEKGNLGPDNVQILLDGMEGLPKHLLITAEDFATPIATAKAFLENGVLMVEAEIREEDFKLYPAIGFESIEEIKKDGNIIVKRSALQNIALQSTPNIDSAIGSIAGQLQSGEALLMYY